jgi:L-fucose mutarotase
MLAQHLTHPELLGALASAGHGSTVLIADGNYPHATAVGPNAKHIYLNLRPGMVTVDDILSAILSSVSVERAQVMNPETGDEPLIFARFRSLLPNIHLEGLERRAFYDAARGPDLAVAVASGDCRHNANLLLTIAALPEPTALQQTEAGVEDRSLRSNGSGSALITGR